MNRLKIEKQIRVLSALVEGVSINATCRTTGVAKHTVLDLLESLGCACAAYHHRHVMRFGLSSEPSTRTPARRRRQRDGETFGLGLPLMPIRSCVFPI